MLSFSVLFTSGGQPLLRIWDSIPPGDRIWQLQRMHLLRPQLNLLYGDLADSIHLKPIQDAVICAQSQGNFTNNCGLYTIANSIMLMHKVDPRFYRLKKNMRQQLIDMLFAGLPRLRLFAAERRNEPQISQKRLKECVTGDKLKNMMLKKL